MEMTTLIIVGVIVLIAIITIIGILSRYRKCKSDELLVVYGKTGSHKEKVNELDAKGNQVSREVEIKTARVYHGVASMEIEELNSNRDKFLTQARDNINTELNKLGLYLININISDIRDAANYIENLGQKETTKARAQAEAAIARTEQEKIAEIKEAEAKAKEAELNATVIVPANKAKEKAIIDAEAVKQEAILKAEAKAAEILKEAVEKMIECGMTPQTIVQYKTVGQLKGIAEASAEMYEHIHLGQVTVYGNENTAGSFMAKTAENLNPAFELLKSIPFKKTFKEMFVEDKKDNPTEDNFEAVK